MRFGRVMRHSERGLGGLRADPVDNSCAITKARAMESLVRILRAGTRSNIGIRRLKGPGFGGGAQSLSGKGAIALLVERVSPLFESETRSVARQDDPISPFSRSFMILSLGALADDRNQSCTLAMLTEQPAAELAARRRR
jgi:hypothetical protein